MHLDPSSAPGSPIATLLSTSRLLPAGLAVLLLSLACLDVPAASQGLLLVANKGDRTLGLIDPVAGSQVAAIPEDGITGHEVAVSPDGRRAFVPIYGDSGVGRPGTDGHLIRVMDLAERRIVNTLDLGKGLRPHCAVFGPHNGLLYVTTEIDHTVTVIDPHTLKVIDHIPTEQPESHMLAITRDGRRGFTSNVGPGTVSVLDLEARKTLAVIPVASVAQRISLSRDDRWAVTADQTRPRLAVIDTATNGVRTWIPLPGIGYGTAPTPDGRWLLVTALKTNQVAVIDLQSMTLARSLPVPPAPQEIVVQPDGAYAYVSCDKSAQVAMLDLKEWKVAKLITAGKGADGLAWAEGAAAQR
jgi:YVTN family beta-propeller protein